MTQKPRKLNVHTSLYNNPSKPLTFSNVGRSKRPKPGLHEAKILKVSFRNGAVDMKIELPNSELAQITLGRYRQDYQSVKSYAPALAAIGRYLGIQEIKDENCLIGKSIKIDFHEAQDSFFGECTIQAPERQALPISILCKNKDGQLVFKCPACGKKHLHGTRTGHKSSHCHIQEAFPDGYHLVERNDELPSEHILFDGEK